MFSKSLSLRGHPQLVSTELVNTVELDLIAMV